MTVPNISDSFLRGPAPNATLHKLDFERTSPPIPEYKGHFAAIVDNFMTEAECKELVRLAEESTRSQLPDSTLSPPYGNMQWSTPAAADKILDRMMPFMRECELDRVQRKPLVTGLGPAKRGEVLCLSRLNERLRFLQKSLYTIHLYLNGEGEQDMEELLPHIERAENTNLLFAKNWEINLAEVESEEAEVGDGSCTSATESLEKNEALLGGATSFMAGLNWRESLRVFPKTGSVLIFQQRNLFHGGDDVFRGVKYTLRTDVMYTTE
ncbi:Prolyl 4-hydroxylase alpha subunit [Penicillium expansum]|nr:Prolyl 4-hydroxylase alpha subunit [Penicillium expansum]